MVDKKLDTGSRDHVTDTEWHAMYRDTLSTLQQGCNKKITLSLRWPRDAPNMWVPWKL